MTTASAAAETLRALGERYFTTQHTYDPYNATLLGLTEFDSLAGDPSRAASEAAAGEFAAIAGELEELPLDGLTAEQRVDARVLDVLTRGAGSDAAHSLWAANASAMGYVSRQGLVFQAVPAMTAGDAEGAERYEHRLAGVAGFLTALGERYAEEAADGRVPTALGVHHALGQLEGHLAVAADEDALLGPARAAGDPALLERATELVRSGIRPAMAALAERLRTELLTVARPDDRVGIDQVPGGAAGYRAAVARHTTTDLTPDEVHQIGLDTLDELRPRWAELGQRLFGTGDLAAIADRLRTDAGLRFGTSDEIIDSAAAALARARAVQDDWFPARALPDCAIEAINPADAAHSAMGWYRPPADDGSRPGVYHLLATDPQERHRYEYEALTFHESVPGHHLQLATAQQLDLPRYRRHLDVEACSFNEGWGLYAERLAEEMGLYSDELSLFGMLSFAALRACRLVIDTGVHSRGWTREQSVEFMYANTATTLDHVRSEVDRYICWPGQALAYRVGQREILRLRAEAAAALGARFDLRAFHEVVLGSGAVPLAVLAENVTRWTSGQLTAQEV
ncbi:DUF885 domain-containing protein [Modestobacter sp. NPDC049651]|uniref:DUF885 domain-containing protein n=1 Tax=unclassified Modestobacter TaxID=2643866 RepID=UPI0033C55179